MSSSLAVFEGRVSVPALIEAEAASFDFSDLRIFTEIPRQNHDVVAMHGLVIVFDRLALQHEGVQTGKLYVREGQRPHSAQSWEAWLAAEQEHSERRAQPWNPLRTSREVVQAIEHPAGGPAFRLASRFIDGPYKDYAYGIDLIGKVVGIYHPGGIAEPPNKPS